MSTETISIAKLQQEHRLQGNKLCRQCGEVKPLAMFYRTSRINANGTRTTAYSYRCKACEKLRHSKEYHALRYQARKARRAQS